MSSLQDIMNVDEDPKPSPRFTDPSSAEGCPPPPTTSSSTASRNARYISEGNKVTRSEEHQDLRRTSSPAHGSRPSLTAHSSTSSNTQALASRRPSTTSVDSMDHPYGYGHGHGHGRHGSPGQYNPNPMMRPFSSSSAGAEAPVKLTPITGRVSRAKKGVPVHTCDQCRPAKTFTRAEHLRRHQLSHENPKYPCLLPGCDRAFHRKDLLERHQQRHELEGDKASKSDSRAGSRRTSTGSADGAPRHTMSAQGYATPSSTPGMSLTPNMPSAAFQSMGSPASMNKSVSPRMGGGSESYRPAPTGGPGYNNGYSLSNETSRSPFNIQGTGSTGYETPPSMTAPAFSGPDFTQPRTTPAYSPLILQTKDLSGIQAPGLDIPPELSFQQDHWPSSATDSPYSTPSENSRSLWPNSQRSSSVEWQPNNMMSPYQNPVPGLDTLPTNVFFPYTTSPPMAEASVFAPAAYNVLSGFPDENTLLDLHQQHQRFANTVRSTTPPTLAQGSDLLVSPSAALPSDRLMGSMACMGRQKEVAAGLLLSPALMQSSLSSLPVSVSRAIPEYIEVYWREVHEGFPIVHRRSFEDAPGQCEALRHAMAAVATQHLRGREHRIRGHQLHDYAWQQATKSLQMSMSVMQAILLCEVFTRFRGRKAAIRPSREFRSVYGRVLDPTVLGAAIPARGANHGRWQMWLNQEAQRRLLAACFVLDVHASVYQEQHRVRNLGPTADDIQLVPLTTPWIDLWEAPTADSWAALVETNPSSTPTFLHMLDMNSLNSQDIDMYSRFDKAVILAREYLDLQSQTTPTQVMAEPDYASSEGSVHRIEELFPNCPVANTYLALHHTPLHDLLAVSGESWVFSHKLLQESSFAEQKKRLRQWSSSPKAAAAVGYACRALHAFTSQGNAAGGSVYGTDDGSDADDGAMDWDGRVPRRWRDDMSDYWSMYVCALICWAFGHQAQAAGSASPASSFPSDAQSETGALAWLQTMAATQPEHVAECRSKEDTMLVVGLARRWLESDVFERNRLYVDAVRVLRKLEEGVNWKWF